jgi:hypothetical protein
MLCMAGASVLNSCSDDDSTPSGNPDMPESGNALICNGVVREIKSAVYTVETPGNGRCFGSGLRLYDLSFADGRACGCGWHADRRRCREDHRQTTFRSRRSYGCRQRNRLWGDRRELLERRRSLESGSLGRVPLGPRRPHFGRNRNRRKNADGRLLRTVQEFRRCGGGR